MEATVNTITMVTEKNTIKIPVIVTDKHKELAKLYREERKRKGDIKNRKRTKIQEIIKTLKMYPSIYLRFLLLQRETIRKNRL